MGLLKVLLILSIFKSVTTKHNFWNVANFRAFSLLYQSSNSVITSISKLTLPIHSLPQSKKIKLSYLCNHTEFFRILMFDPHLTIFYFIPDCELMTRTHLWLIGGWLYILICVCVLSHVQLFATPWTVAFQASLSMELSRQKYWSSLPLLIPKDVPDPGIEPASLASCIVRWILDH